MARGRRSSGKPTGGPTKARKPVDPLKGELRAALVNRDSEQVLVGPRLHVAGIVASTTPTVYALLEFGLGCAGFLGIRLLALLTAAGVRSMEAWFGLETSQALMFRILEFMLDEGGYALAVGWFAYGMLQSSLKILTLAYKSVKMSIGIGGRSG